MITEILVTFVLGVILFAIMMGVSTWIKKKESKKITEESDAIRVATDIDELPEGNWEQRVLPEDLTVERKHEAYMSFIEPSLESLEEKYPVSNLDRLIWLALVVEEDTGQKITVTPSKYWSNKVPQIGYYNIHVDGSRGSALGPYDYDRAWAFMTGVSMCAEAHFHKYGIGKDKR